MNWKAETEGRMQALRRIVALLLFFAALAGRASILPGPVRPVLMWILRHVEAVARDFVVGRLRLDAPWGVRDGGPAEAKRLALSFRALAVALEALVWRLTRRGQVHVNRDAPRVPAGSAPWVPAQEPDTS